MMLFRNTSAFFLAVCTSLNFLTCPVVGQPPPKPPLPPPPPCPGNSVALLMYDCPVSGDDKFVFRTEIDTVYGRGTHDCIEISSATSPSQSDLEYYDIIIVEGTYEFLLTTKAWLKTTGNTALVNLAIAGKKVFFNAAEVNGQGVVDFPAGVSIDPFVRIFSRTYAGNLASTLSDPYVNYHTFNPLLTLPPDTKQLLGIYGKCGSTKKACNGPILVQLPIGGLLLGTVQTSFRYATPPILEAVRSDLRKTIYIQYMCAPVSPAPTPVPTVSSFCGSTSMAVDGEIVMECCDEANNLVGKACCGATPYDPVLQECCSDDAVVNAGTDCDCA